MDRMLKACAIAAGTLITSAASADLIKVADSVSEFSGVQGQDSWSYGWYSDANVALSGGAGSLNTSQFKAFEVYESSTGWWSHDETSAGAGAGASPYFVTVITAELMHANAAIPGSGLVSSEVRWASRRWTSEVAGSILVEGDVSKFDYGVDMVGDGTEAYVLLDGEVVFHYSLGLDDFEGASFSLELDVLEGSQLEMVLGAKGNPLFDATEFSAVISTNVVPAPGALALLGAGGVLAGRRRRRR